jgi:hypothetical protein
MARYFYGMRLLLAALVAFPLSNAFAFDGSKVAKEFDISFDACRMGQDKNDNDLSDTQRDSQCARRDKLAKQLKAHGYCWDKSEVEWALCK